MLSTRSGPELASIPDGLLHLDVVVTDAVGKPARDLKAEDFTLLDGGQPNKIVSFHAFKPGGEKPESAVRVILVIDALNNGFVELAFIRQGLQRFLLQNGGHLLHPASLLLFTKDGIQTVSGPSKDGTALASAVAKLNPSVRPRGLSQFVLSLQALTAIAQSEARQPGRKLLIWLGRGWPYPAAPERQYTMADERDQKNDFSGLVMITATLRDARITLYGGYEGSDFYYRDFLKGVKKSSQLNAASMSLDVLAIRTGGRGSLPNVNRDSTLDVQLNGIVADADTYYTLSFNPPHTDNVDEYRDLKVILQKPGMTAHSISGYYNQPSYRFPEQKAVEHSPRPVDAPAPTFLRKSMTVEQLGSWLGTMNRSSDSDAARQIYSVKLTDRLSTPTLLRFEAMVLGEKSRAALVAIADESQFLAVPANEIVAKAQPDIAAQRKMVSNVISYLGQTIPKLPNFFAARKTVRYEDTPEKSPNPEAALTGGQSWRIAGRTTAIVQYRDGKEASEQDGNSPRRSPQPKQGLITRGTFGPILSMTIVDAHGEITFDHWEKGSSREEAIFKYKVAENQSHYTVAFQTPSAEDGGEVEHSAYHGEIAIDPASGAILRIALIADLANDAPITRGDVMVEYAPVEIGGKSYMCPVRSVSVSIGQSGRMSRNARNAPAIRTVRRTLLNDVSFSDYHLFRSEMRIITGDEQGLNQK